MMVKMDKDGVKIGKHYWPFAYDDGCSKCRFMEHLDTVEGVEINRDICRMTPEDEDEFLFGNMPEEKTPPCLKA